MQKRLGRGDEGWRRRADGHGAGARGRRRRGGCGRVFLASPSAGLFTWAAHRQAGADALPVVREPGTSRRLRRRFRDLLGLAIPAGHVVDEEDGKGAIRFLPRALLLRSQRGSRRWVVGHLGLLAGELAIGSDAVRGETSSPLSGPDSPLSGLDSPLSAPRHGRRLRFRGRHTGPDGWRGHPSLGGEPAPRHRRSPAADTEPTHPPAAISVADAPGRLAGAASESSEPATPGPQRHWPHSARSLPPIRPRETTSIGRYAHAVARAPAATGSPSPRRSARFTRFTPRFTPCWSRVNRQAGLPGRRAGL